MITKIETLNGATFSLEFEPIDRAHPMMKFKSINGVMDVANISTVLNKIYGLDNVFNPPLYGQKQGICMSWFHKDGISFEIPINTIINVTYMVPYIKNKNELKLIDEYFESGYTLTPLINVHDNNMEGIDIQI
jgi:hypothetical protein